jgi:hypothetical protein
MVNAEIATLPESARAAIERTYANDPVGRANFLATLKAGGLASAPLPTPATTAPVTAAPTVANANDTDVAAATEYERLAKTSPTLAAQMRLTQGASIEAGRRKLTRN